MESHMKLYFQIVQELAASLYKANETSLRVYTGGFTAESEGEWVEINIPEHLNKITDYKVYLHQILKYACIDYPVDSEGNPLSIKELTMLEAMRYIDWLLQVAIDNNIKITKNEEKLNA